MPSKGTGILDVTPDGGYASGEDPLGYQSVVSIGFYTDTPDLPIYYVATDDLVPGETPKQALVDLQDTFNADFASLGYTATLDPSDTKLCVDVPAGDMFYADDTDTGFDLAENIYTVPAPSAALGGGNLIGILFFARLGYNSYRKRSIRPR